MATAHQGRDQIATVRMGAKRDGTVTAFHVKIIARLRRLQHAADAADPVARGVRDGRLLRDPERADGHRRRVHEQVPDGRDPRRRAARGDAHDRGHARPARRRAGDGLRSRSGARTSSPRTASRRRSRPGSSTTRATTTRRSTSCSSTSTWTRSAREQQELRSEGIYRGIGFSTYTEICGLAPSRITGPGGVGSRPAAGSPRWSASTTRARSPPTPAPRATARGTRRRSRRSSPTGSASTPRTSR